MKCKLETFWLEDCKGVHTKEDRRVRVKTVDGSVVSVFGPSRESRKKKKKKTVVRIVI